MPGRPDGSKRANEPLAREFGPGRQEYTELSGGIRAAALFKRANHQIRPPEVLIQIRGAREGQSRGLRRQRFVSELHAASQTGRASTGIRSSLGDDIVVYSHAVCHALSRRRYCTARGKLRPELCLFGEVPNDAAEWVRAGSRSERSQVRDYGKRKPARLFDPRRLGLRHSILPHPANSS